VLTTSYIVYIVTLYYKKEILSKHILRRFVLSTIFYDIYSALSDSSLILLLVMCEKKK